MKRDYPDHWPDRIKKLLCDLDRNQPSETEIEEECRRLARVAEVRQLRQNLDLQLAQAGLKELFGLLNIPLSAEDENKFIRFSQTSLKYAAWEDDVIAITDRDGKRQYVYNPKFRDIAPPIDIALARKFSCVDKRTRNNLAVIVPLLAEAGITTSWPEGLDPGTAYTQHIAPHLHRFAKTLSSKTAVYAIGRWRTFKDEKQLKPHEVNELINALTHGLL